MSIKAVEDFCEKVATTESLHADAFKAWTQGGMPAVLAMGQRLGYEFTPEEIRAVRDRPAENASEALIALARRLQEAMERGQTTDELSDADLDLVAGGGAGNPQGPFGDKV